MVHQDSTEGYKFNSFLIKYSNSSRKQKVETLKKDIELFFVGKPELEYREDPILKKILTFLDY